MTVSPVFFGTCQPARLEKLHRSWPDAQRAGLRRQRSDRRIGGRCPSRTTGDRVDASCLREWRVAEAQGTSRGQRVTASRKLAVAASDVKEARTQARLLRRKLTFEPYFSGRNFLI